MICKFTVHFSTSFSTTSTSFRKNRPILSCRLSHSRLRHLLDDFGERRFGGLLFCLSFIHTPMISRVWGDYRSIWTKCMFMPNVPHRTLDAAHRVYTRGIGNQVMNAEFRRLPQTLP